MAIPTDVWGFVVGGSSEHWVRLENRPDGKFKLVCLWQTQGSHSLSEDDLAPVFSSIENAAAYIEGEGWRIHWYPTSVPQTYPRTGEFYGPDSDYALLHLAICDNHGGSEPKFTARWIEMLARVGVERTSLLTTLSRLEDSGLIERTGRKFRLTRNTSARFANIPAEHLADLARICRDLLMMPHRDWPPNYLAGSKQRKG